MDPRPRCASLAWAAAAPAQPAAEQELPSCVSGSPPLRLPATSERAALDATDRKHFQEAAQARYLLYQRGGLLPTQVLLLRRGGQWQYVTLARGEPPGLSKLSQALHDQGWKGVLDAEVIPGDHVLMFERVP